MNDASQVRRLPGLLLIAAVCGAAVQIAMLWFLSLPLGVSGEWTWDRLTPLGPLLLDATPAIILGTILALVVYFGERFVEFGGRGKRTACVLSLWFAGFLWLLSLVASTPGIASLSRVPFVLYYTRSSGYFTQASEHQHAVQEFLTGYRERIADSSNPENHLHLGTHPPGLTLGLIGILRVCDSQPAFLRLVEQTFPQQLRDGNDAVYNTELLGGKGHLFQARERVTLWLAALLMAGISTGTVVPLYLLARRSVLPVTAWWLASFWLLVPASAIFFPKSDILFPCLTIWGQWCWLRALDRNSAVLGFVTGLIMCLALTLSLAFVPVALVLFVQAFVLPSREASTTSLFQFNLPRLKVCSAGFGALLLWLGLWAGLGGMNLFAVWVQNLRNHAAFYAHHTRSYWPWLLENPIELGIAIGLPLAALATCGLLLAMSNRTPFRREIGAPVLVWLLLWISGKNMGEASRLWIFLMPYLCWFAAAAIQRFFLTRRGPALLMLCFLLQLLVCIATAIRIDGFGFRELGP